MKTFIRTLIGRLTKPENAVRDVIGDWWISVCWVDLPYGQDDSEYQYHYQHIKQNWYGRWVVDTHWLHTNVRIEHRTAIEELYNKFTC